MEYMGIFLQYTQSLYPLKGDYRVQGFCNPDPLKDPKNGTPQYEPITTFG